MRRLRPQLSDLLHNLSWLSDDAIYPPQVRRRWKLSYIFSRNLILEDEWTLNRTYLGLNENGSTSRSQNVRSD